MTETTRDETRRPLLAHLEESGAELEDRDGPVRVGSFGDPDGEYASLTGGAAVVDDTDRALMRVGPGRKEDRWHETVAGLLTNHVEALEPDRGLYSFLLTAQGSPVAEMRVVRREEEDWLDMPAACLDGTLAHFEKYLPPLFASYAPDPTLGRLGLVGPRAAEAVADVVSGAAPGELEPLEGAGVSLSDVGVDALILRREPAEGDGFDLYVPLEAAVPTWRALRRAADGVGGGAAGHRAREVRRVELGLPAFGSEIDGDTLPQETGQTDRAVSFEKGCYTGQEVVVRIEHRGQVNRHLRGLDFDEGALPEAGAALFDGERQRGTVTTPARSPRFGPIALGYVRREVEPGASLALEPDGPPACRVRELPFGG